MISRHPDTAAKKARFLHFLKEAGGEGRKDIRTYFDLIEFDEGRIEVTASLSAIVIYASSRRSESSAFSSVSLLPISSHFPLIWNVFTGLRV